jgi:hypothetical protein
MHQWMNANGGMHTFVWNALAEKLGLTSDELTTEVNSGKTIAQIAEEKGVSRTDLVATLEAAHKDSLTQAVTDGYLTQEQADGILSQMAGRYEWMLDNAGAGYGMMGGRGGMMGGRGGMMGAYGGQMHTYMVDALAEQLGMTSADLQARIDKGETPYQVMQSYGKTDQEIGDIMNKVHDQALDAAVKAGALTQEQADWMDQHHEQMFENGWDFSNMPCHNGLNNQQAAPQP